MQMRLFGVSLGVALLAACAAPEDTHVASQDTNACRSEYRTGTNIPVKTCVAPNEDDQKLQKQEAEQMLQGMRTNPMKASP